MPTDDQAMNDPEVFETASAGTAAEWREEMEQDSERVFDEVEELELAAELLGVQSEAELDHFLGNFLKSALRKVRGGLSTPVGRALGGLLKGAIHKALPSVGRLASGVVGPDLGGQLTDRLAAGAGNLLGLELEGLSGEDQELEVARQLVRLGASAVDHAAAAAPGSAAVPAARAAVSAAAAQFAPGLVKGSAGGPPERCACKGGRASAGRWERRGPAIILHGL